MTSYQRSYGKGYHTGHKDGMGKGVVYTMATLATLGAIYWAVNKAQQKKEFYE